MSIVNNKKIAFFLISLYGGGGEKVVLDLAKGFVADGFEVDLLLFRKKGALLNIIDSRINLIELKSSRILFSIFPIIKYLKKENPIAILGTSEHANLILILAKIFSLTRTKVLCRVGMKFSDLFKQYKSWKDKMIPLFIKFLYPKADTIMANSKSVAQDLIKVSKIPKNKIKIIYNSKFIDEIKRQSEIGDWKFSKDKFTILAMGRLEKQKDFETLIKSFALVKEKIDAQLIILGEGGEGKNLKLLTKGLNLENIHLLGFVENPYFYIQNADILVSTSLWEGFSNVLIEAGILGLPIIATDCGRELLAPDTNFDKNLEKGNIGYAKNGILVAKQDIKSIAEVILKLAHDKVLRKKYSERIINIMKEKHWSL